MLSSAFSFFIKSTVSCGLAIEGVGFTAQRKTIGIPFVMPPFMPPELFVFVITLPFSTLNGSLHSLPRISAAAKPAPNSTPLIPPRENTACDIMLSTLSNHGSPSPAGVPQMSVSVTPPTLSEASLALRMRCVISSPRSSSRTGKLFPESACISPSTSPTARSKTPAHL